MSDKEYWASLNKMLKKDEIEFNKTREMPLPSHLPSNLVYKNREHIKKGVQFALNHFNEIAKLEYENNDGQPVKTTLKHLQWAKVYIESNKYVPKPTKLSVVDAYSRNSVGKFLLDCHHAATTQNDSFELTIQTDGSRKQLITYLFGNEFIMENSHGNELNVADIASTQIIFESGDVKSAIDELIVSAYDRTLSPWRIKSVYVEETLKNSFYEWLKNATTNLPTPKCIDQNKEDNEKLAERFGGKCINGFLFDVPTKYLPQSTEWTAFYEIPVAINFFRTTKEAIQLVNADNQSGVKHITSIWTGNIEIYYELVADLNAKIIWSNSIGAFDDAMPSLNANVESEQSISSTSTINTKSKYAVHVLQTENNTPKYLYIPFGKTFAN